MNQIVGDIMDQRTLKVIFGALLHNTGEFMIRAGLSDGQDPGLTGSRYVSEVLHDPEVVNSVRYQTRDDLAGDQNLSVSSAAYIINVADRMVTGNNCGNLKEMDTSDRKLIPMSSLFNIINNRNLAHTYRMTQLSETINYPIQDNDGVIYKENYEKLLSMLKDDLTSIELKEDDINYLLSCLERYFSFVPYSSAVKDVADISVYDHSKMVAAYGACIQEYLNDCKIMDYRSELLEKEEAFRSKDIFLMFTGDFSGIQSFIFNVIQDGALKRLRSRSFFLEILMEHIVRDILSSCGLSRANLIYSGGGHCYLLLPNTQTVIDKLVRKGKRVNAWLRRNFGTQLFFACAYTPCSANDLMNIPAVDAPYEQIYRKLGRKISEEKMHRYSADEILELNAEMLSTTGKRECKICGEEVKLCKDDNICQWCDNFEKLSPVLLNNDLIVVVSETRLDNRLSLPFPTDGGEVYYYFVKEKEAREMVGLGIAKHIYTKNQPHSKLVGSTNLYIGDYVYSPLVNELVDERGFHRLAVLRADVDDLGSAFIRGFARKEGSPEQRNRYNTLSRTSAFSRQMSMFFKYYLNQILEGKEGTFRIGSGSSAEQGKKVVTVYSGGDDVFLIGNFRDILEAAVDIRSAFVRYTAGALTISFGIGVYPVRYPLYSSAEDTADMEDKSKQNEGKNSITLFTATGENTYRFDEFTDGVVREKLDLLFEFFQSGSNEEKLGNSLLHRLLQLLRDDSDRINIARYAYLLARLEPKTKTGGSRARENYRIFSGKMYDWILRPKDRKELITAISIYSCLTRKGAVEDHE